MKIRGLLTLIICIAAFSSAYAKPSKCIVKPKYKVEKEGNNQYLWCLDDWDEDGDGFFYTTRRYVKRGISLDECEQFAKSLIGVESNLKFAALSGGLALPMDPHECKGTIESIHKIKYKKAKVKY